jgi:hypothetical protein
MYAQVGATTANGNLIQNASGLITNSGNWLNDFVTLNPPPVTTTGGTIATNVQVSRVAPAGAITGVILAPGVDPKQRVYVINGTANSITFAASGTSNVANGTGAIIAANTGQGFNWEVNAQLWYPA